jgi:hypothetical protein
MTIERAPRRQNFTVIDQRTLNDDTLSFRARGVLAWILDKPDHWKTTSEVIARSGKEGRDAVRAALTELEDAGYMERTRQQGEGGKWYTTVLVHEVSTNPQVQPKTGKPTSGNQSSENQASSFRTNTYNKHGANSSPVEDTSAAHRSRVAAADEQQAEILATDPSWTKGREQLAKTRELARNGDFATLIAEEA